MHSTHASLIHKPGPHPQTLWQPPCHQGDSSCSGALPAGSCGLKTPGVCCAAAPGSGGPALTGVGGRNAAPCTGASPPEPAQRTWSVNPLGLQLLKTPFDVARLTTL